jgi:hypothetical protein
MPSSLSELQLRARAESQAVSDLYLTRRKGLARRAYFGALTRNTGNFVGRYARHTKYAVVRSLSGFWSGVICCLVVQVLAMTIWIYQVTHEQAALTEPVAASAAVPTAEVVFAPILGPESLTEIDPDVGFPLKLSDNLTSTKPERKPDEQPLQTLPE